MMQTTPRWKVVFLFNDGLMPPIYVDAFYLSEVFDVIKKINFNKIGEQSVTISRVTNLDSHVTNVTASYP